MKKTVLKLGLSCLLMANFVLSGPAIIPSQDTALAAEKNAAVATQELQKTKGKITNISQKAKTIALAKKDKSFFLVKFDDATLLKGVESSKEFKVGEAILVNYKTVNGENLATSLEKALVKLPKGTKEIKTEELASLLQKDSDNTVVIDARPPAKYAESHIEQAISIPFSKLTKMGDDGAKLLADYKGKQLIFYCGGPT